MNQPVSAPQDLEDKQAVNSMLHNSPYVAPIVPQAADASPNSRNGLKRLSVAQTSTVQQLETMSVPEIISQPGKRAKWLSWSGPVITDGRYNNFTYEDIDRHPRGYPSLAAFISSDIDGRIYRRFSYVRNRILLRRQDEVFALEQQLLDLDDQHSKGDEISRQRLISRRFDEEVGPRRKEILDSLESALAKYDDLLLREHQIMSIDHAPPRLHKALFDFVWNGKLDPDGRRRKHLLKKEYEFLYRRDDFLVLGTQEDAWLGKFVESITYALPRGLRSWLLSSREDRAKSAKSSMGISFYSNERINTFVKAFVCAATTVLLVVPIIVLYALSIHHASGWLMIGILLIFVIAFAFALAALTNANRSEMFGASAGPTEADSETGGPGIVLF